MDFALSATLAEKNCWTRKVHFAIMLSKIQLEDPGK